MKHSIVIVDDHTLMAEALRDLVNLFEDFQVLYQCGNGLELQEKMHYNKTIPEIIMLDVSMPIMDGYETAKWLTETHPDILILVLSVSDDESTVLQMIKNGAKGYMLKNTNPTELKHALNQMLTSGFYYPNWASKIVFDSLNPLKEVPVFNLFSDREKEFLTLTITELSYKEIADQMCVSPRTVDGYRDNLFEKLKVKTRVGLAVYALKHGFENLSDL